MNTIKLINEGFNKRYIKEEKSEYTKLYNFKLDDVGYVLDEAKISPEDKHDSDVIRGIYAKMRQPGRKQFSDQETAVMKKYGLDFSRDNRGRRDNLVLVAKDGHYLPYYGDKDNDKVNYADKARKIPERRQDSKYKRDNPRWNPENQSIRNPKQTWSRWQDDQEMKSDYRDKYRDLYTKRMFINSNKAKLDLEKDYLSRLQQQVADTENNVKANQQSYDQQRAEWKKMLADRRAKKNESFKKVLASKPIKESATPYGGDKKSFYMFYVGPTSGSVSRKDVIDFAKKHNCDSIYWASDDATGYKASYNGDTLVVFNRKDINDMPDDYKEDAKKYGKVITESFSLKELKDKKDLHETLTITIGGHTGDKVLFDVESIQVEELGAGYHHFYYVAKASDGCLYGWNLYKNHYDYVPQSVSGVVSRFLDVHEGFITEIKNVHVKKFTSVPIDNSAVYKTRNPITYSTK